MKTVAAVLVDLHQPLELIELELPPLKRGQVLVRMQASGICRSQINEIRGYKGADPYLPHTLGHEGSGIVVEVGEGITKVRVNDKVIVTWLKGSGLDAGGTIYQSAIGKVNSGPISTFMEYAVISENRLIAYQQECPPLVAALFGCAVPTGAGIICNDLAVQEGHTVAIFGVGGIGLSAVLAAHVQKAGMVIALDVEEEKLAFAQKMGATHVVNLQKQDPISAIATITQGRGVDFSVEAAGVKSAMEMALRVVREKGGVCCLAGNVPQGVALEFDPFDFIKGRVLKGSWGGGVLPDRDIPAFFERFRAHPIGIAQLISHIGRLEEINEMVALLEQRKVTRALIAF